MHFMNVLTVTVPATAKDFKSLVSKKTTEVMDRFMDDPTNQDLIEFIDCTKQMQEDYRHDGIPCFQLVNGTIVPVLECDGFIAKNGIVYQRRNGSLKRTKQAKRTKLLPHYPNRKLYPSFADYANDYGYLQNEENGHYGFWANPQALWDYYVIDGSRFLVKEDCEECITDPVRWFPHEPLDAPEHCKWVCAARKSEIQWDVMHDWHLQKAKERFAQLEQAFATGTLTKEIFGVITEDGIRLSKYRYLYRKGETEAEYLERIGFAERFQHPINLYGFIEQGVFHERAKDMSEGDWSEVIESYVRSIPDSAVLVSVDCHC